MKGWRKRTHVFYFHFIFSGGGAIGARFQTELRNSPWEVCERSQPICFHPRDVSQTLSIKLFNVVPSMAKHVNVI